MNKSIVIILVALWVVCTLYFAMSGSYDLPYRTTALVGSCIMSVLVLICLILFVRQIRTAKRPNERS